jgi:hypothetical protein
MTRSYVPRAARQTQPLPIIRRSRPAVIGEREFRCFRLVPTSDGPQPVELVQSSARMFAFVTLS